MRARIIFFASIWMMTVTGFAVDDPVVFKFVVGFLGADYKFVLRQSDLKGSEWDGEGRPPLSIGKAAEIARGALLEVYGYRETRELESVSLFSFINSYWYYEVVFKSPDSLLSSNVRIPFRIIVFLDGTVLKPTKEEWR